MDGLGLASSPGGAQFDFVETLDSRLTSSTAAAPGANVSWLSLVRVGRSLTIGGISVVITNQGDNIDVGIYELVGSTYTLRASSGSTSCPATGLQRIALTTSFTMQPGTNYYLAVSANGATLQMSRATIATAGANAFNNKSLQKTSNFPLANFTSPSVVTTTYWLGAGA